MARPVTFLVDNGSLEPAATLALRGLAQVLAGRIGGPVASVSLLHASAIAAGQLEGVPAEIFEPALARRLAGGETEFVAVPLFFGPSRALTGYLPERVAHLRKKFPALRLRLAAPLYQPGDGRLAQILADQVRAVRPQPRRVALVDHGSPVRAVTAVRDDLAAQLRDLLGSETVVAACSMERRAGAGFAFGDPLLENLLAGSEWTGEVVIARQFLLPGRHAGPGGDIERICRRVEAARPGLHTRATALVGAHPGLSDILAARWREAAQEI